MKSLNTKTLLTCGLLLWLGVATVAQAAVVPTISVNAPELGSVSYTPEAAAFNLKDDGQVGSLIAPLQVPGAPWLTITKLDYDADPIISAGLVVQNVGPVDTVYTFSFLLPAALAAPNLIRGSIDTSLIGQNATISALAGSSVYSAMIDGSTVKTLQDFPFSLSTPQNAISSFAQFGFDPSSIPVVSTIGIDVKFKLSPGDIASVIADFEIVPVPEPSTLIAGLLLLVPLGLKGLRSWRKHS